MKQSKTESSNRIIIYQMPLFERVMMSFSAIVFILLGIGWILVDDKAAATVILLCIMAYCVLAFLDIFMVYICLDIKNSKLIIREAPGIKKQELLLSSIVEIKISDGVPYKEFFTIDVICKGYTVKVVSWSAYPTCRLAMFGIYKRQTKRLCAFAKKCNEYLTFRKE